MKLNIDNYNQSMPESKLFYVYILKCKDQSYYTGITSNLIERVQQHQSGWKSDAYTHSRRPVELVFHVRFTNANDAIAFEKRVKGWSRKKKEALINGDFDLLKLLAKCRNETSHINFS